MPSKNIVKTFVENGYYHVYNRGVERRSIFINEQDCAVFLRYLKLYLSPIEELQKIPGIKRVANFIRMNLSKEIDLLSFSLMPNHIHLEMKQYSKDGISKLMKRIATSYVMYFNRKYKRVGPLFQHIYKASFIDRDEYLLHLSRYIHLNPLNLQNQKINFTEFSSYPYYLGLRSANWVKPKGILDYFSVNKDSLESNSYKEFVEEHNENAIDVLGELLLEDVEDQP